MVQLTSVSVSELESASESEPELESALTSGGSILGVNTGAGRGVGGSCIKDI